MDKRTLRWPTIPYKGLDFYRREDEPIFAGRYKDIIKCAGWLGHIQTRVFVLHGRTASGKSSFLRAGLIPHLERYGHGFRFPERKKGHANEAVIVRSSDKPLVELAKEIFRLIERINRTRTKLHTLRLPLKKALLRSISLEDFTRRALSKPTRLLDALGFLSEAIPYKLILIIDQSEEVFFSSMTTRSPDLIEYVRFLKEFARAPLDIRLCLSMRTEYKGLFDDHLANVGAISAYYLPEMDSAQVVEAIQRPTLKRLVPPFEEIGKPFEHYRFQFAQGLPERIDKELRSKNPQGGLLPVLQVILRRLYLHTREIAQSPGRGTWTITEENFLELGGVRDQIGYCIEEALRDALQRLKAEPTSKPTSKMIDQWRQTLLQYVHTEYDGRVTTKRVRDSEIQKFSATLGLESTPSVLETLSSPELAILRKDDDWNNERVLGHDSIGLALAEWRRGHEKVQSIRDNIRNNPVLKGESYTRKDLYGRSQAPRVRLTTVNDMTWDHMIPLYAEHKEFTRRLGLTLSVNPDFDLTKRGEEIDYDRMFDDGRNGLIAVPKVLFPDICGRGWTEICVLNLYTGHALVGEVRGGLTSLQTLRNERFGIRARAFKKLVHTICRDGARIWTYEPRSRVFVSCIYELAHALGGLKDGSKLKVRGLLRRGIKQKTQDVMYRKLLKNHSDFIVGPAPSRALAQRSGFCTYLDFEDLESLIDDRDCPLRRNTKATLRELLSGTLMYNSAFVRNSNLPRKRREETLLRLAAVLYYTVEHICADPESFVRFINDRNLSALPQGAFPIDRASIRSVVSSAYRFVTLHDYGGVTSPYVKSPPMLGNKARSEVSVWDAEKVYQELLRLRYECDLKSRALNTRLEKTQSSRKKSSVTGKPNAALDFVRRAWKNYSIYNFFDANRFFEKAINRLGL